MTASAPIGVIRSALNPSRPTLACTAFLACVGVSSKNRGGGGKTSSFRTSYAAVTAVCDYISTPCSAAVDSSATAFFVSATHPRHCEPQGTSARTVQRHDLYENFCRRHSIDGASAVKTEEESYSNHKEHAGARRASRNPGCSETVNYHKPTGNRLFAIPKVKINCFQQTYNQKSPLSHFLKQTISI